MRSGWIVLGILLVPVLGTAQVNTNTTETRLPFNAPEAWAMKYFTSVTLMTGFGPPPAIEAGSWRLGLEAGHIPTLSARQRAVGFGGTKEEDLNKLPILVRPRMTLGLPGQFSLTVGGIPPVRIRGVKPRLLAVALGRPLIHEEGLTVGATVAGQVGEIEGDFTCSAEQAAAGDDFQRNPFACEEPSNDVMTMRYVGLELSAGYRFEVLHGLTPYVLIASNYLSTRFQVNARYARIIDRAQLHASGVTGSAALGVTVGITPFLNASGQVFFSPLSVSRIPNGGDRVDGLVNGRLFLDFKIL